MTRGPFQIFGPFDVDGEKAADTEYQKAFWKERDEEYPQLSESNGLYLFSIKNRENYEPNYVGSTNKEFCKEVFNPSNVVKILKYFAPQWGKVKLHLLAKPKDTNAGFYRSSKRSLLWTEMFLLMLCRKKNPEILNIVGHTFLEDCAIQGVTYPSKGKSETIKSFRSAVGIENHKSSPQPKPSPIAQPIVQTTQPGR